MGLGLTESFFSRSALRQTVQFFIFKIAKIELEQKGVNLYMCWQGILRE